MPVCDTLSVMAFRRGKRARTAGAVVVQTRQVRPIDKSLINVNIANAGTTQRTTILKTTTFPCTVVGLRWSLVFFNTLVTGGEFFHWVIVVVPDGVAVSPLGTGNANDLYTPEQHVLAYGVIGTDKNEQGAFLLENIEGSTKTMRKLKTGDVLMFTVLGVNGAAGIVRGTIQFFCKS